MEQSAHQAMSMGLAGAAYDQRGAGGLLDAGAPWADAGRVDMLVGAALLLAALALLLLWRHQQLAGLLDGMRAQYAGERSLRASAEQALLDTHANLCRLTALQEHVRETERKRIGGDIHDDLGQHLLALKMECCALRTHLPADAAALHARLDLITGHLDLTLLSLRSTINALRPPILRAGLGAALKGLLADFTRIHGLAHQLDAAPEVCAAAAALDVLLFRLTQEALSNIARHAGAHNVAVSLRLRDQRLLLTVADDGIGLPVGAFPRGCGLLGMEERSAAAGGRLVIASEAGRGTTLSFTLPVTSAIAMPA